MEKDDSDEDVKNYIIMMKLILLVNHLKNIKK